MRRLTSKVRIVAVIAFLASGLFNICQAIQMKGISYTAWDPNAMLSLDGKSDSSLEIARGDGCTWVAICVWWFQDNVNSTSITPDYTRYSAGPESVIHAINRCHDLGMKVMLKPMVDCRDGNWRGNINPSAAWFTSYRNFITYWADIAQACNVEMVCVGCELKKTTGGTWASSWQAVIADVRTHYSGSLTYAANHDNVTNVLWWDKLDYIGIDAYYALTQKTNPTLSELITAWENRANLIENWRNNNWPGMDIIFAEVGYQSTDGTNITPWWRDPSGNPIDLQEQADCYRALLTVCSKRNWWLGAFWWNWETDPQAGGINNPYHPMQNKPAESVLVEFYTTITGDFDDDHDVDGLDLMCLAEYWLRSSVVGDADISNDHTVNINDFAELAGHWLEGIK